MLSPLQFQDLNDKRGSPFEKKVLAHLQAKKLGLFAPISKDSLPPSKSTSSNDLQSVTPTIK